MLTIFVINRYNKLLAEYFSLKGELVMDYLMLVGAILGLSTAMAVIIISALAITKLNTKNFIKQ